MVESIIQIKSEILINVDASVKNIYVKRNYIWNPATCSCENGKYLTNIMDNSVITCDEIVEEITVPTNFNEKSNLLKKIVFYLHFH